MYCLRSFFPWGFSHLNYLFASWPSSRKAETSEERHRPRSVSLHFGRVIAPLFLGQCLVDFWFIFDFLLVGRQAEFRFICREDAKALFSSCQVVMMDVETFVLPLMVRPGPRRSGKVKECSCRKQYTWAILSHMGERRLSNPLKAPCTIWDTMRWNKLNENEMK